MVRGGAVATPLGVFSAPGLGEGVSAQLLIRPEGRRVAPADGAGATAQVMAVQLLGRLTRLRLAVAGIAEPLEALVPGVAHPQPGESVRVGADATLAFVFAEEAEAA
jgi:iron(III) transport system ATP-binding protein